MIKDSLWEKAFLFKSSRMWNFFIENEIFAIEFANGEIGYCIITGVLDEHIALIVYQGEEGLKSLRHLHEEGFTAPCDADLYAFEQVCLQCSLENKEDTDKLQEKELRAYARRNGIRFSGAHSFPNLLRYRPYRISYPVNDSEANMLEEALDAALYLNEMFAEKNYSRKAFERIGFNESSILEKTDIPVLKKTGNTWNIGKLNIRDKGFSPSYRPALPSALKMDALKKKRGYKKYDIDISMRVLHGRIEEPVGDDPAQFVPPMLFMTRHDGSEIIPPVLIRDDTSAGLDLALGELCDTLAQGKPHTIFTCSERVYEYLEEFCEAAGIELHGDVLPEHEMLFADFDRNFADPVSMLEESGIIDALMYMSDDELKALPREFLMMLSDNALMSELPKELLKRIISLFS